MKSILIIQTASIGDVILATGVLEKLHKKYPEAKVDILVKKGNETLFKLHPFIRNVLIFDKKDRKYRNLLQLLFYIRKEKYDCVINLQRFLSTGILTAFSGARYTSGFDKNPLSFLFSHRAKHVIVKKQNTDYPHEIERNHLLISNLTDNIPEKPRLYPSTHDYAKVSQFKLHQYVCIAPASLWVTKQFPSSGWIELVKGIDKEKYVYLLGSKDDSSLADTIMAKSNTNNCLNLCGKLSLQESTALMQDAVMNYVCDSSPMHLASSVNANTTAIFCSTIPEFGFGPLSENARIVQTKENLSCRPCGLHGHQSCPKKHFKCSNIDIKNIL